MALVSALKILLRSYLGQDDVQVATLVANRNRSGTAGLIGPFTNTVILRTKLAGDPTFREVMQRVRATIIGAFAHQELPFEDIVDTLEWKSSQEAAALSRIMIILHNASLRPIIASGGSFAFEEVNPEMPMPLSTITPADIIFNLRETGNGLEGYCVYKPHVFGVDAIRRLLGRFEGVIQYMVAWPERSISSIQVA
jgi:hypothetical protein